MIKYYEAFNRVKELFGVTDAQVIGRGSQSAVWQLDADRVVKFSAISLKILRHQRLLMRDWNMHPVARIQGIKVLGMLRRTAGGCHCSACAHPDVHPDIESHSDGPMVLITMIQSLLRPNPLKEGLRPPETWTVRGDVWHQSDVSERNRVDDIWVDTGLVWVSKWRTAELSMKKPASL